MSVEYKAVSDLIRALGTLPADVRAALRPGLLDAGEIIARRARANAAFSQRIPGAIYVKARFSSVNPGIVVGVDAKKAPEAKPLELGNAAGKGYKHGDQTFRHPVFADPEIERKYWTWTTQNRQPFLHPALDESEKEVEAAVGEAVAKAARIEGLT